MSVFYLYVGFVVAYLHLYLIEKIQKVKKFFFVHSVSKHANITLEIAMAMREKKIED